MTSTWVEPSRAIPLRWGTYRGRYLAGLWLIISGLICLQGANVNFGLPLGIGTLAHVVGWWVMPAAGWRRLWAVLPSLAGAFILLIGPAGVAILAVPFASWLLVRHRPAITFALPVALFAIGMVLREYVSEYSAMLPALAIMGALLFAFAWGARFIASSRLLPSNRKGTAN
jgi:hypothetical protein